MPDPNSGPIVRLDWLDYGRVVCALGVMLDHYLVITLDPRVGNGIASFGLPSGSGR